MIHYFVFFPEGDLPRDVVEALRFYTLIFPFGGAGTGSL